MNSTATTDGPVAPATVRLGDATRVGGVELTVTDLERSIDFYTRIIGLQVHTHGPGIARLGVGAEDLVTLHEDATATDPGRDAGIYHFALLFPSREELARVARRIVEMRTPIDGASDHGVSEAIYRPDPDRIGVELAVDRPRAQWAEGAAAEFQRGGPAPLDVGDLMATIAGEQPSALAAPGLKVGHVHLHVGSLEDGLRFYRDGLGFEVQMELPTAFFVSAGGYHHHLGFNVWRGRGAPAAADRAVGLRHWALIVESDEELAGVRDRLTALGFTVTQPKAGELLARDASNIAVRVATERVAAER
jgi:catechol 2,3-dioxygenase